MTGVTERERTRATLGGAVAALIWGTTVAGSRVLTEAFGGMLTIALVHAVAALPALAWLLCSRRARQGVCANSLRYLLGCGGLFVVCALTFFQAVDLASSPAQVVVVGIINYLWPALSLGLSLPLLGNRARPSAMLLANLVAFSGVALALASFAGLSPAALPAALRSDWRPYLLAFAAALSWGLYNNLSRRWGGRTGGGGVPLFIIALALLMSPVLASGLQRIAFTPASLGWLLYVALLPTFTAYFLWDRAQRRGHHTAINALAYAIPVLSTLITGLTLRLTVPPLTWLGCLLVIAGAMLSRLVMVEPGEDRPAPTLRSLLRAGGLRLRWPAGGRR